MGLDRFFDHAWEVGAKWFKRLKWILLALFLYFSTDKMINWVQETAVKIATSSARYDKAIDSLNSEIVRLNKKYKK